MMYVNFKILKIYLDGINLIDFLDHVTEQNNF